ncbi:hypothetical protein ACGH7X_00390 [Streptomyces sp. BBFR51]|uniref:hypothetical protein n=1 Tax=Streptomyces sp. BBFR51 TaxID=3372856 RepID=UPI0037DC5B49
MKPITGDPSRGARNLSDLSSIAWNADQTATGQELPADAFTIRYPDLDPAWDFDFDDREETARTLPALTALYSYGQQSVASRASDRGQA